jgi:hypothetical protein
VEDLRLPQLAAVVRQQEVVEDHVAGGERLCSCLNAHV